MISFIWPLRKCLALAIITLALNLSWETRGGGGAKLVAARPGASQDQRAVEAASSGSSSTGLSSYFNSARQLLSTSLDAHNQARAYSGLMPNEDPRTTQMLRDIIDTTSNLIQSYQHDGLSNLPNLPNVPGLYTVMRLPDKVLRAELSVLQDGVRMARDMQAHPLTATINVPKGKAPD
jgi:hypothetical protein